MKYSIALIVLITLFSGNYFDLCAQTGNDELISLSESIEFSEAVKIFDVFFQRNENKVLINMSEFDGSIGLNIEKIHWKAALRSILMRNNLILVEKPNAIMIQQVVDVKPEDKVKFLDDILIEVTFFEADFNAVKELGIDWSTFFDGQVQIRADIGSSDQVTQDLLGIAFNHSFPVGSAIVDISTLFRALAASDKGHIISRPQITVLSGETGTVQDGMDYTVLVPGRTTSGDEIPQAHEVSVQSGTIVNVTPSVVVDEDNEKAVQLTIKVERSTAQPDVTGFSKKTSEVNSQKILYSGEETIIGGLTTKETVYVRKGIPFLKDLPWWVLGIRYLTGYNRSQLYNKELIILIKATILPTVQERRRLRRDVAEEIETQRKQLPIVEEKLLQQ